MPEAGGPAEIRPLPRVSEPPRRRSSQAGRDAGLALLAGIAHTWAFAPFGAPWLEVLALAVPMHLAARAPAGRPGAWAGARIGWAFGLGWFIAGVSWVYISLHGHGGLAAPFAALATLGLAALLALFPAAALASAAGTTASGSPGRYLALGACWTLSEWLRGVVLTGFPWLACGYAHTDGPLSGYAAIIGVYGVGAVATACALLLAAAMHRARPVPRLGRAAALLLAAALPVAAGAWLGTRTWSQPAGAPIRVRLVQGNIPQDLKFAEDGLGRASARYLPALQTPVPPAADVQFSGVDGRVPDLIVLPESAFPLPVNELPDELLRVLADERLRGGADLIFGAFIVEPGARYFNSAIGLAHTQIDPQRYSKRHLVPFGEFIPYGMHWFVQLLEIPIGDQQAGGDDQPPMELAGQRIAVNICFEDLFGALIRTAWRDPGREPTMLLNLSNLAWFDDSIALPQHLQISRMRALETSRPLLRATNTGVTAAIDERGRVLAQLPIERAGVLETRVQGQTGRTPFVDWGNAPVLWTAAIAWLACAARHRLALDKRSAPGDGSPERKPGKL